MSLELDRYEPIKAWMLKNPPKSRSLQRALASNKGNSLEIPDRLSRYLEANKDSQSTQTFIDEILANDEIAGMNGFLESLNNYLPLSERAKGIGKPNPVNPHTVEETSDEVNTTTHTREVTNPNTPNAAPTSLQRMNQTNGEADIMLGEGRTVAGVDQSRTIRGDNELIAKNSENTGRNAKAPKGTQQLQSNTVIGSDPDGKPIFGVGGMNADDMQRERQKDNYNGRGSQGLRDMYDEAEGSDLQYSDKEKFASNLQFELFSYVPPGYGNGIDNKLFRMDVNRKRLIEWCDPLNQHRQYDGPTCGIAPLPYEWQNTMTDAQYSQCVKKVANEARTKLEAKNGPISSSLLGEVFTQPSSKGLPQTHPTFFQKAINVTDRMTNPVTPCGMYLREPNIRDIDPIIIQNAPRQRQKNSLRDSYAFQSTHGSNWME